MECELCGKDGVRRVALIEGIKLSVCENCASHGKIISDRVTIGRKRPKRELPEERVRDDFARIIREARKKKYEKGEDFAKRINEKLSLILKIESGKMRPSIPLARRIEKDLKVDLVIEVEDSKVEEDDGKKVPKGMTFGDLIEFKE